MATLGTTPAGEPVRIDVDRLVVSRLLLQANSGGGKSWALRRLLEQTHGKVQHLVLDIEGEFHTLRERFDYVLAARTGGDVVADVRAAGLLAHRLLELGVSAIVDLYELKAHERIRFVRLFLEALIDSPKSLWRPALVVVDEAHQFCPQTGECESAAAVKDLLTRGRKRGFCGVLATQRLSKLHKDAAAEANCKLIGRASLDVDLKRAADELGFTSRDDLARIRSLAPGTFFAYGPGLADQVVEVTVGDVQTTHPKPGAAAATVPPPRDKVRKVLAQLADLPKEADEEARTLAQAKAENARLRRELAAKPAPAAAAPPKVVEVPVLKADQITRLEAAMAATQKAVDRLVETASAIRGAITPAVTNAIGLAARSRFRSTNGTHHPKPPARAPQPSPRVEHGTNGAVRPAPRPADGGRLPKGEAAVLSAIAQHGADGVTREQLTVLTGYKRSTRDLYLQKLQARGAIEQRGDTIVATEQGVADLGDRFEPLPTGDALREHWFARLPVGERAVLRVVTEAHPNAVDCERLSEVTGYKRSTRDLYVQKLAARKLVERDRGQVRASAELFGGAPR